MSDYDKMQARYIDLLTNESDQVRSFARLMATEYYKIFGNWIDAELARPEYNPADAVTSVLRFTTIQLSYIAYRAYADLNAEETGRLLAHMIESFNNADQA